MTQTLRNLALLIPAFSLLGACATTEHWSAAGGDRDAGVVKISYEHEDESEPTLSETKADQMADNRCKTWGYSEADLIPGLVRSCSSSEGDRCEIWKVTREYQCGNGDQNAQNAKAGASLANNLAK